MCRTPYLDIVCGRFIAANHPSCFLKANQKKDIKAYNDLQETLRRKLQIKGTPTPLMPG
jgi:hypothetical protein